MSTDTAVEAYVHALSHSALVELVLRLGAKHPSVRKELLILSASPKDLADEVRGAINKLRTIRAGRRYVRDSEVAEHVAEVTSAIERIGETAPDTAMELLVSLMELEAPLMIEAEDEGLDISLEFNGTIPDVAAKIASFCNDRAKLVDHILTICTSDSINSSMDVINAIASVLPVEVIRSVVSGLIEVEQSVAGRIDVANNPLQMYHKRFLIALGDVDGYVRLATGAGDLSTSDALTLCSLYCDKGEYERALEWFNQIQRDHRRHSLGRDEIEIRILTGLGRYDDIYQIYHRSFLIFPTNEDLEAVTRLCGREGAAAMVQDLLTNIRSSSSPTDTAILFLLSLGYTKEMAEVVSRMDQTTRVSYYSFGMIALSLRDYHEHLGATVAYRLLLSDILDNGRSKAYAYGAEYLEELRKLARVIRDWGNLQPHDVYVNSLQQQHRKKYAFWSQVREVPA